MYTSWLGQKKGEKHFLKKLNKDMHLEIFFFFFRKLARRMWEEFAEAPRHYPMENAKRDVPIVPTGFMITTIFLALVLRTLVSQSFLFQNA